MKIKSIIQYQKIYKTKFILNNINFITLCLKLCFIKFFFQFLIT